MRAQGIGFAATLVVLAAFTIFAMGSRSWLPPLASEHGGGVDSMIGYLLVATGVFFVAGHAALAVFVVKFSGDQASAPKLTSKQEWGWTILPVVAMTLVSEVGVLMIGMPTWSKVYGEAPADAIEVEIVAKQFEWLVHYPGADGKFGRCKPKLVKPEEGNPLGIDEDDAAAEDDLTDVNRLVVPAGRTVVVRLRSLDVLHSFFVPQFRIKQDVVPGLTGRILFQPTVPGKYEIACAELCGLGHYRMRAEVEVLSADAYGEWLKKKKTWNE